MNKLFLLLTLGLGVMQNAMATTEFVNPSKSGQAFKAKGLLGSNKKLANRICFLLTHGKSSRALDFTIDKKNFNELSEIFPKTLQESPYNPWTHAQFPTIISDVTVEGSMNPRDADLAVVDTWVRMSFHASAQVKYFSKLSCE